jgi:hypothetical protein
MEATRRSGRAAKPKRHFDSSPYPPSKPRGALSKPSNRTLPKPQIALQPVVAEDSSIPHSFTTPQPFPAFVKLPIQKHNAKVLLAALEPFEIFSLFFPPELLHQMITVTNSYALRNHHNTKNPWKLLCLPNLYVFFGYLIYMGIHREPDIACYWRTHSSAEGPFHNVREHMSLTRF